MLTYSDFYNLKIPFDKEVFENQFGEKFYVIKTKHVPLYFITGDEYDWELFRLFNPKFDLYDSEEIIKLGKALQKLCRK